MGLRRASHVAWRRVGDETVLIHLKTKRIYVLNESAGFFWHSLDGARGTREILDGLSVTEMPTDASTKIDGFFDQLEGADLIESGAKTEESPNDNTNYRFDTFVPPEMVWQEELRNFGQSCARDPGEAPTCDAAPTF